MAKSIVDLATQVLEDMNVLGAGQDPEAADVDKVSRAYRLKYAEINAPGFEYAYWDEDEIPEEVFKTMADLVMNEVRGAFGMPLSMAEKDGEELIILKRLRRHVGLAATGLPVVSEYF